MNKNTSPAEETLRMLAKLPAPEGLAARVQAGLRTTRQRTGWFSIGNVFGFSGWMHSAAMRAVAAAGIVLVVAGGGWQIYSHVQLSPGAQGVAVPVRVDNGQGGFSTSGAIAKPDPLKAPVVTHQVQKNHQPVAPARKSEKKKHSATPAPAPADRR